MGQPNFHPPSDAHPMPFKKMPPQVRGRGQVALSVAVAVAVICPFIRALKALCVMFHAVDFWVLSLSPLPQNWGADTQGRGGSVPPGTPPRGSSRGPRHPSAARPQLCAPLSR